MYIAKKWLGKRVHLINQSSYPSGSLEPSPQTDAMYKGVLQHLDVVASREPNSTAVLERLGIKTIQSFDCLPCFIHRHGLKRTPTLDGPIILAGGVSLCEQKIVEIAEGLKPFIAKQRPVLFVTGAKNHPAAEEKKLFEAVRPHLPEIQLVDAGSAREWLEIIGSGSVMVSARFHHSIAAASQLTPVVCLPSNTPKIEGACTMLGITPPLPLTDDSCAEPVTDAVTAALDNAAPLVTDETWQTILALGAKNFEGL